MFFGAGAARKKNTKSRATWEKKSGAGAAWKKSGVGASKILAGSQPFLTIEQKEKKIYVKIGHSA